LEFKPHYHQKNRENSVEPLLSMHKALASFPAPQKYKQKKEKEVRSGGSPLLGSDFSYSEGRYQEDHSSKPALGK
jgi:hypothetical protein